MSLAKELRSIPIDPKTLKNFGLVVGLVLILLGVWFLKTGRLNPIPFFAVAVFLVASGLAFPRLLTGVYRVWMGVALCLGWAMARVLLSVMFYAVVTPLAVVLRLLKKDLLKMNTGKAESYWVARLETRTQESYKNQF
ncbi:MAG: hypothetical protein HYZ87_03300 [Candidatus Omnitrophica bacterium]|nr:hypothetical protein [Candidatus Omnitrophota bacterium]